LTATSLHTLPQCSEVIPVAIAAPKFELRALARRWIVAPPGEQGPAVSSHGWQMAHVLATGADVAALFTAASFVTVRRRCLSVTYPDSLLAAPF